MCVYLAHCGLLICGVLEGTVLKQLIGCMTFFSDVLAKDADAQELPTVPPQGVVAGGSHSFATAPLPVLHNLIAFPHPAHLRLRTYFYPMDL